MKRLTAAFLAVLMLATAFTFSACTKETMGGHTPGMAVFDSKAVEYKFEYPATWQTQMNEGMVCLYVSSNDPSNVSIATFGLGEQFTDLENYITSEEAGFMTQWNAVFGETDFGTPTDVKMGGMDAKKYVYEVTVSDITYKYMQVFALGNGNVYTLTYAARTELFDEHLPKAEHIISTFQFK